MIEVKTINDYIWHIPKDKILAMYSYPKDNKYRIILSDEVDIYVTKETYNKVKEILNEA